MNILQTKATLRIFSLSLLVTILFWLSPSIIAQPVVVPDLNPPGFQSQDIDPYFNTAAGNLTQDSWGKYDFERARHA